MRFAATALERLAIVLASLALSAGLIAVLSGFFAGRDQAGISGGANGPGQAFPDQGHAVLAAGQAPPRYDSDPPTSGPHVPELVLHDETKLNDNQLLQALQLGNVVIEYATSAPRAGLRAFARSVLDAPFSPALAAAGQAVILAPGASGARQTPITALAWAHLLRVGSPSDPKLREFVEFWLGRGAPGR